MKILVVILNLILIIMIVFLVVYLVFSDKSNFDQSAKDCRVDFLFNGKMYVPLTTCEEQEDNK